MDAVEANGPALRHLAFGDAGRIIVRHAELYAVAQEFEATFEALAAEVMGARIRHHDPARRRP